MPGKQVWNDGEIARHKQPVASGASTFRSAHPSSALVYPGKVDHGSDEDSAKELQARLKIEYRAGSAEGRLRHPLFKGIREDLG